MPHRQNLQKLQQKKKRKRKNIIMEVFPIISKMVAALDEKNLALETMAYTNKAFFRENGDAIFEALQDIKRALDKVHYIEKRATGGEPNSSSGATTLDKYLKRTGASPSVCSPFGCCAGRYAWLAQCIPALRLRTQQNTHLCAVARVLALVMRERATQLSHLALRFLLLPHRFDGVGALSRTLGLERPTRLRPPTLRCVPCGAFCPYMCSVLSLLCAAARPRL